MGKVHVAVVGMVGHERRIIVETFHPNFGDEVVGEGMAGNHLESSASAARMIPPRVQLVTLSKVFCKSIPFLLAPPIYPPPPSLEDCIGFQVLWEVKHLRRRDTIELE